MSDPLPDSSPPKTRPALRVLRFALKWCAILLLTSPITINLWVLILGNWGSSTPISQIPKNSVAVVLGTSPRAGKYLSANMFFEGRMNAAAELYHSGTVYHLILSGDNRKADYNEPQFMHDALLQRGVPSSAMTLDYAGLRTLDSAIRAKRVFQLSSPVFVTDNFHLPRTIFIAKAHGLKPLAYGSTPIPWEHSYKVRIREWASRIRAFLDIYLLRTQPLHLGDPITIPEPDSSKQSAPAG